MADSDRFNPPKVFLKGRSRPASRAPVQRLRKPMEWHTGGEYYRRPRQESRGITTLVVADLDRPHTHARQIQPLPTTSAP